MKRLNVIMLCDTIGAPPSDQNFQEILKTDDWKTERQCYEALQELGHTVRVIGIYDDIRPLLETVWNEKPDIVFNMVESFRGESFYDRNIVGLLELMQLPYTGSNPAAMVLCKNKAITKEILSHHKISVPRFKVYTRVQKVHRPSWLRFPLLVKPLRDESSWGISKASLVTDDTELKERLLYIHESLGQDAISEEYIKGRELYVSLMGNKRLKTFPIRELFLPTENPGPQFATYKVKWDKEYRKKWNVRYSYAEFDDKKLECRIFHVAKRVYRLLRIQGYARIDLRLTENGNIYIIEANPNPGITKDEDFTMSLKKGGLAYKDMIQKILQLGFEYHQLDHMQE